MGKLRGHVDCCPALKVNDRRLPNYGTGFGVQGHHDVIEPPEDDHRRRGMSAVAFVICGGCAVAVVTYPTRNKNDAVIIPSAADEHAVERRHLARDLCWLISPPLFPGCCVKREN